MTPEQSQTIDQFLMAALLALDRIDTLYLDRNDAKAIEEARSKITGAGCALDPDAFAEEPSGMAALNRHLIDRAR